MIFKPTGTSTALINAVKPYLKARAFNFLNSLTPCGTLLDLACGCGIVGNSLSSEVDDIYASDISQEAVDYVSEKYPDIEVKCGNLFDPWESMKFDYIVDDVSGVAEEIAKVSPWFDGVPCDSGKDGADLVVKVLEQAPKYLNENGKLFFPIVSLSNVDRILDTANRLYKIELLSHTDFPLPKKMYKHIDLLKELKKEGIQFQEKFGLIIFFTDIYMAKV